MNFWTPKKTIDKTKEEGTPTPLPSPSSSITSELVKYYQPLIYDSDDEYCSSTPKKELKSAFFPTIGIEVKTPVYDHETQELRMIKPQLFRQKGEREGLTDSDSPSKNKHVRFSESYPEKFRKHVPKEIDVRAINEEREARTPRCESPVPFLSLEQFLKELKDDKVLKK
jgi:hypothetical protein